MQNRFQLSWGHLSMQHLFLRHLSICGCGSVHFIDLQSQVCAIYKWENCLVELSFIDGAACQLTQFGLFIQGLIIRHRLICHHQHALIVCYVQVFRVGMLESWNRLQGAIVERTFCLQLRFFIRECMAIIGAPCWSIHNFVESNQLGCQHSLVSALVNIQFMVYNSLLVLDLLVQDIFSDFV